MADGEQALEIRAYGNYGGDHIPFPDHSELMGSNLTLRHRQESSSRWVCNGSLRANGCSEMLKSL